MMVAPNGYDLRDLVDMLTERRSRDEKERILRAINALRKDDRDDAKEDAHLFGSLKEAGAAFATHPTVKAREGK